MWVQRGGGREEEGGEDSPVNCWNGHWMEWWEWWEWRMRCEGGGAGEGDWDGLGVWVH